MDIYRNLKMNKAQFIEFSRAFLLNYCTSAVAEGLEKGDAFDHRVISDELQVEASEIDGDENGNLVIVDVVRDVTLNADIDNIFSSVTLSQSFVCDHDRFKTIISQFCCAALRELAAHWRHNFAGFRVDQIMRSGCQVAVS